VFVGRLRREPRMQPAVWMEPEDVGRQLAALGLIVKDVEFPVVRAVLARNLCTPDHPRIYLGMTSWGEGNAALRFVLGKKRQPWTRYEKQNIPRAVNPEKTIAITLLAGDANTGNPDPRVVPQPKRRRQEASQKLVVNNVEPFLPGLEPDEDADAQAKLHYLLWYRKVSQEGDFVYSELSLPTAVGDNGTIEEYLDRIILPVIDMSQGPGSDDDDRRDDQDPDLDVPVQRRTA
jgi:hypothetical protein